MNQKPLSLALLSWISLTAHATDPLPADLGNLLCIGDSITHGFKSHSYRWPLHKTLVDNGVQFISVGIEKGNAFKQGSIPPGTAYAGVPFNNLHAAMSSERAYEIAGRINTSGRLGNSNIHDWLGLDATYTGQHRLSLPEQTPNTVLLMIGTNDTFGDYGNKGGIGANNNMHEAQQKLLGTCQEDGTWSGTGDLDVIIAALRQINPQVRILVLTIPTWHDARRNNNQAADYAALAAYNKNLIRWAAFNKLETVDVNTVLANPARTDKPGVAEEQFFLAADRLHPTPQGDLLIAETVAKALGIPGRTAGLPRRASADLNNTPGTNGFTICTPAMVGNGATDGWITDKGLQLYYCSAGNNACAQITISESAIIWGENRVLYCGDMSAHSQELRIVWHTGQAAQNIPQGFYVWLGNTLIGEALPTCTPQHNLYTTDTLIATPQLPNQVAPSNAHVITGSYAPPAL